MTIDIINYTEDQFAVLSTEKLLEIRSAQRKKDDLTAKLQEEIARVKRNLVDGGVYPSSVFEEVKLELTEKYELEVQNLRDALLFYLHYVADGGSESGASPSVPYLVDYSLSAEERMVVVKEYYENTYEDKTERYEKFKEDNFARSYLGELYAPLYDYFYFI